MLWLVQWSKIHVLDISIILYCVLYLFYTWSTVQQHCLCVKVLTSRSNMLECIECRFLMCTLESNWSSSTTHGTMPSLPAPAATHTHRHAVPYRTVAALPSQMHAHTRRAPSIQQYPCTWSEYRSDYISIYTCNTSWIFAWLLHNKNRKNTVAFLVDPRSERASAPPLPAGRSPQKMDECVATNWHACRSTEIPASQMSVLRAACMHARTRSSHVQSQPKLLMTYEAEARRREWMEIYIITYWIWAVNYRMTLTSRDIKKLLNNYVV